MNPALDAALHAALARVQSKLADANATWPRFHEHKAQILEHLRQDPTANLETAYVRAVSAKARPTRARGQQF